ncbi:VOC family protein [Populibacterium corticicola]|uniref:VOC family protein n=1 Tax=Populibacterium corticicola TaxID=1812826 RepID=A0ABW5XHC1_9MICO
MIRIGRAVLPVTDLAAAIDWYVSCFGFRVLFDQELFPGFRSVHVGPGDMSDPGVWLFPTDHPHTRQEPALVLYSTDIDAAAARLGELDTPLVAPITGERGSRSLQVRDPSGNVLVIAEVDEHTTENR